MELRDVAWKKSGIWPLNPGIFTEADYAPSRTSSTKAQLPKSFPRRLPRAPDASSDDAVFDGMELIQMRGEEMRDGDEEQDNSGSSDDSSTCSENSDLDDTDFSASSSDESDTARRSESDDDHSETELTPRASPAPLTATSNMCSPTSLSAMPTTHSTPYSSTLTRITRRKSRLSQTPQTPTSPTSKVASFSRRPSLRELEMHRRLADLERENTILRAERDSSQVHAVIAAQEASVWRHRFNQRLKKKDNSTKRFKTDARIVTSQEGRMEAMAEAAKKAARKQAEKDKRAKKQQVDRDDVIRRAAQEKEGTAFSGSLKYKTKRDMIDIAFALGVESEGTSAQVLRVRLHSHFEAYPALKEDPRYIGLFTRKRKRADAFKENELPPAHRHSPMPSSPTPSLSHTPSSSQ
ncbi:hypothetical protein EV360DRAFT_90954, partial [Lentinula raphanica]